MAAINPEDLEKLKKFIDFVSANPLILNVPQLGFMKRFIEKFGGKVPEGEYQMPAGGKCPFGGDAKTETKTQPPPSSTQDADEAEPVVEEESEESEVELDMEETANVQLLEPNVLYLDEKPPKIVKARTRKTKKKKKPLKVDKLRHKSRLAKKSKIQKGTKVKKPHVHSDDDDATTAINDDPLLTMEKPIKMEIDVEMPTDDIMIPKAEEDGQEISPASKYSPDTSELKYENSEDGSNEENAKENEENDDGDDYGDDQDDSADSYVASSTEATEEEDDEPLIMIAKRKGRPPGKQKLPRLKQCRGACKQKCSQKFNEEQREKICNLFWSLAESEKREYIRQHARTKVRHYIRLKNKSTRQHNSPHFAYYLDGDTGGEGENKLIRVCRKYFESTLHITNYKIKKALEGYEAPPVIDVKLLQQQKNRPKEEEEEKDEGPQQYLDPATGDLITIDAKAKEKVKPTPTAPKPKYKPRKRGDPPPEHHPKPIKCKQRCIYKCHTKFTEEERKQICDVFWSLDYNRRKDFILTRIETKDIEVQTMPEFRKTNRPPRAYHTRFYLRSSSQGENVRVCKHFLMNTLSISRMFITNAIDFADKTTGHYTGCDRRGLNTAGNKIDEERMKFIRDHIASYPYWTPNKKSKCRYLHHSLSIKRMYLQYKEMCEGQQMKFVSTNIYYKTFHEDFRLSFLANPGPTKGGGFLKTNPNVSHYTGEEPGGIWFDANGERLDLSKHNPGDSLMYLNYLQSRTMPAVTMPDDSQSLSNSQLQRQEEEEEAQQHTIVHPSTSSFNWNPSLNYAQFIDTAALNSNLISQPAIATTTASGTRLAAPALVPQPPDFNLSLYENILPQAHAASTSSIFRKL
ncbi:uncharacterized protein LOC101894231 isoform X4 [Musca domestica]|uniref:Uncharacterized protein LOC101894231 isoform X4 n=1 Tax=Musca domestica TaxID=7370 RepID=A0A9J7DLP9_MUSDO|nr:uncharacterized protein LOC101894231 isoform X4 [Musca domestica]